MLNIIFVVFNDIRTIELFGNRNDTETITHNIKFTIKPEKN